jgi:sporulation protein YlmC with PRC-barrel domain
MMPHHSYKIDEFIALRGRPVYASDGEKLGDFEELYLDEAPENQSGLRSSPR